MKSVISIAFSVLICVTAFGQNSSGQSNATIVKLKGKTLPNYKGQTNFVENKTTMATPSQLAGSYQIMALPAKNKTNPLLNIGFPFNAPSVTKTKSNTTTNVATNGSGQGTNTNQDPRNLPLSKNGLLLSPDGFEVEFRTSGNPKVTNVCGTPRGYLKGGGDKSPGCSFTVPCDDPVNRDAAVNTTKYFMLRWHVMTSGGPGSNIDQAMITAMMATLNADYATHNMIFCEDSAEFVEDPVNYAHNSATMEVSLKTAYNQRPVDLINIYVVGSMTAGGYARFPYDPMGGPNFRGGIVLNRSNCNASGHTLGHEMGHTFGLEHTFAGVDERTQCSACYEQVRNANGSSNASGAPTPFGGPYNTEGDQEGDWCSDTNPHDTYSYNCSTSPNANGACDVSPWNNAPVNNHMSYSFCSTQFTNQQSYRQHCMANTYLTSWTAYGGGICGSLPPVADFVGSPTTWQSPSSVTFTDLSQPTAIVTGWTWDFNSAGQGGTVTPGTFVGQNPPTIVYDILASATCLDYEVTLTITGNGGDVEVKTSYITVCPPSGDCDTLDFQWTTPAPTVTTYGLSPTDNLTGIPDAVNLLLPTDAKGIYEGYVTPNLGVTTVGAIRAGLGNLVDADDDITFQVSVYDDDGNGQPGALLGGRGGISPTALGVPLAGFYNDFWIPLFVPLTPTTPYFHVGVEIFSGGDLTDELIVMTSCDHLGPPACGPQGEADSSNNIFSSGFGYEKMMPVYGSDFDVDIIPMLGEYNPLPIITGFTETVNCDTTFVTIFDTVFYHDYAGTALVGMSYTFASDGTVINTTTPLGSINRTYTTAGPETITITAINDCGRADTTVWTIPYNFLSTPDAEFTKVQPNPVCMGAPGVDFNANTGGYQDYTWDFGDGTVLSSGSSSSTNHVYAAPGLYYTTLTTTSTSFQAINTFYSEDFESGWPAGYQRFTFDPFTPNAVMNPPFTGTNATAWVDIDNDGDGSTEATSCSWHLNPGEQADDWMLTTGIGVLPANQMLSWDGEAALSGFPDGYEVRISTVQLPATVANYATVLMNVPQENGFRTTRSVSLAAYAGQTVFIAFRNNSTDQFLLYIDNIHVGTTGPGCVGTLTKTDFVEVVDCTVLPPVADMNATDSAGCAPLTITFTDNTTIGDPGTSWLWNFGDGTFSTLQNPPPHAYPTVGTFFVSFESCNAGGCSTEFLTVLIGTGTTALAGPDQSICGGTTATFAGNDPTPDAGAWALLTGSGVPTTPGLFNSAVTGLAPGLNQFTWTITGTGCISVDTVDITIGTPANAGTDNTLGTCATGAPTDLFTLLGVADLGGTWLPAMTSGTGVFDPAVDPAATYQYIVTGTAPCTDDTADVVVTITANDDPTFLYADFCAGSGGVAGIINTPGGTFSFNPDPLDGSSIIPGSGAISNGVGGSVYNIQYLTPVGPCQDSLTIAVNVGTPVNAGTDGTLSTCSGAATTDLFTLLGVADLGGTWVPAMASGTGVFNPAIDLGGTYQYVLTGIAPCSNDTSDVVVTLNPSDDPTFLYADFCAGAGGLAGVINTPGGTFSYNPDPLDGSTIVPGTGAISNGVGGSTYNIQYLTPVGPCQDSLTIAVNVGTPVNAGTDGTLTICSGAATTDLSTLIGVADLGGTWVPAMASGTGVFNPAIDLGGTYQYVVTGAAPCSDDTSDVVVTLNPADDPTFTYPDFCAGAGGVVGVINTAGGTFSFNPDPLDGSAIVPGTGAISNGVGGSTYNIQYLTPAGPCQDSLTIAVNVGIPANAGTNNALGICATGSPIDLFTLLGAADLGGTWVPAMTSGTGVFDPLLDLAGTYQYIVTGTAPCLDDTADVVVTFTANDDATFVYPSFCAGSGGVVGIINTPGGTFSFNPDPLDGSTIVPGTGAISNGVGGSTYNIQYMTPAGPCQDSLTIPVSLGTPANAGIDGLLAACSSAPTTDLFTLITGADLGGTWVPAMASGTGVFDPAVDAGGTYQYVVTGVAPCSDDTSDVVVTLTPTEDPTFNYPDFCAPAGGFVGVVVTAGGTFSFNPDPLDGSAINPVTGDVTNAVGSSVYNIQYLTTGPCPDSLTVAVNVNPCIVLTASFTPSALTVCAGDSIVFTDGSTVGVTIWQWDFDSTSVGGVLPSTGIGVGPHTVFYNIPGTFVVELIVSDGITSDTTSTTITVNDCSPTAALSSSQTSLCEADCITFTDLSTGGAPTTWSWTFPGGNPATGTGANPGSICYATSGSYDVTLTVTNQYGTDNVVMTNLIVVGPCLAPTAGIIMDDADSNICVNSCIDFNYDMGTGGIPDTLTWTFEGGTPSTYASNDPNEVITVCWNDTTNNFNVSVAVSNAFGTSNATTPIVVHVMPSVNAGPDQTIIIGTDGYIGAVATDTAGNVLTGGTYTWAPPTDLSCVDCQDATVVQPLNTNFYTVTYTDQYGCVVTDDVIVNLDIILNIGVPTAFSPNGDGTNDFLMVDGKIVIVDMNFTIYNRYGQKVFETTDIDQGWDGTHNGNELNPAVFVYYLNVTFIDGSVGQLKGNVTLVR